MERPTAWGRGTKATALALITVVVAYPFLLALGTSLADQKELVANGGYVFLPGHPTLSAYRVVLSGGVVTRAVLVSTGITVVGTALSLICTVMLAYALSRPGMLAGKPILMIVLGTFIFSPGIIPTYLVVKQFGMLNSYASLIVPVLVNGFNVIVMRGFFQGIPDELFDAARIDGAGELTVLFRIVLPLSKAVVAVVGLFYAVGYWNSFFSATLYLNDASKWPLQVILRSYVLQGVHMSAGDLGIQAANMPPATSIEMAVLIIAILPILCVYPFVQKYFVKGVLTGAVKA